MTNIDNARNSQSNYKPKKRQAPFTQYGPYINDDYPDHLSANGVNDSNHFEIGSAAGFSHYKSPQTMQEFQYSNVNRIDDSISDGYASSNSNAVPSYKKMKSKLESIRKQNINNVANSILSANISIDKPSKREMVANKSNDNDREYQSEEKEADQVITASYIHLCEA